jgi:hypothetical protein
MKHLATRRCTVALLVALVASLGCGSNKVSFETPTPTPTPIDSDELMARWNAVADNSGVAVMGFGTFHWGAFDQFPHPTYKGGSSEAYSKFALVLIAFYEQEDNFDYLANHHLFTYTLSASLGLMTSFKVLTDTLVGSELVVSAETRQKLSDFAARIDAVALDDSSPPARRVARLKPGFRWA